MIPRLKEQYNKKIVVDLQKKIFNEEQTYGS